jgi:molecular chaperone HscB
MGTIMNPYEILKLNCVFDIDLDELEERYESLSISCHPDRFLNAPQKKEAVQKTVQLNEAYAKLKNPRTRLVCFAEKYGLSINLSTHTTQDPEVLIENFEWQERISKGLTIETRSALLSRVSEIESKVPKAPVVQDLDLIKKIHTQLCFFYKLLERTE